MTPWRSDTNHANVATQSHSIGAPLANSVCYCVTFFPFLLHDKILNNSIFYQNKNSLELVPQHMYSQAKPQVSVDAQAGTDWDLLGRHQNGFSGGVATSVDADDLGRYSPLASR